MFRRVLVVCAGGLGTATLVVSQSEEAEGLRRSFKLWSKLAPVVVHYRAVEFDHKFISRSKAAHAKDQDWERLHARYSQHVLDTVRDLKGFYIKVGQVLASRPDTLPKIYIELLRTLEDAVPYHSFAYVTDTIRNSLGVAHISDVFTELDEVPCGSASIGQVHRGVLRSGQEVAVKVQYPDVEALFRDDIATCRTFCRVLVPEQLIIFDEIEKQFLTEFDYRREAEHLDVVHFNMSAMRDDVVVPKPYMDLCTREVLVMEFLHGVKLVDRIRAEGERHARRLGKTYAQLETEMREKYEREGLPPVHNTPGKLVVEAYRTFWSVTTSMCNVLIAGLNAFAWVAGRDRFSYVDYRIGLNPAAVMDVLLRVHGHQLLVNGFFNGDPHAGNFLMLDDGRIGLIDYGQVKRLTAEERHDLCRIYIALKRDDKLKLMELSKKLNYKSRYYNEDVLMRMTTFSLDRDGRDVTDGLNVQQFLDKMYQTDPWEDMSDLLIMPVRMAFLLRGVGLLLNHPVSCVQHWAPIAERVLRDEGAQY